MNHAIISGTAVQHGADFSYWYNSSVLPVMTGKQSCAQSNLKLGTALAALVCIEFHIYSSSNRLIRYWILQLPQVCRYSKHRTFQNAATRVDRAISLPHAHLNKGDTMSRLHIELILIFRDAL